MSSFEEESDSSLGSPRKRNIRQCRVVVKKLTVTNDVNSDSNMSCRKSSRPKSKPKKYGDFLDNSPMPRNRDISGSSEDDASDFDEDICTLKPTALFSNDDVDGQDIFKFKSRHTKNDLQNKVKLAISNSPKMTNSPMKTPRKSRLSKVVESTPKHVKEIIKKRIIRQVQSDSEDSEADFSASSSDFVPDESREESSSASASEEEQEEVIKKPVARVQGKRNECRKVKDSEYMVTPDNYFMMHSSKKIVTSDHTLDRLKNFNLTDNAENEAIVTSEEHTRKIQELNDSYKPLFNRWLYDMSENFNIILYGVGSKRAILHQFQQEKLKDFPCIVVNGFFPSLTVKSILESIVIDLLECHQVPSNIGDVVSLIDAQLRENDMELFLIIHNIDGPVLRTAKAQAVLANVSQIRNVRTLATIDHINAPLLWDHSKLSKFNFTWWDVTTFLPYTEETSYENSLMAHKSSALQLSSLRSVHQSLTTNAKGIFNIIIQYQLDHHKQPHYQGLPFKELYSKSREQFLVSSDAALRAQLTEFLDHKLVRMRRTVDGSENLVIPLDNALLQQFLELNS